MKKLRSDYIKAGEMAHILAALMPENRLACEVSMATGLRISDVLAMRADALKPRMSITEIKTGKKRRVYMPAELLRRLEQNAGFKYVFEGRSNARKPRTRQAVYKDIKRAAALFRLPKALQLSPHSLRKIYAVGEYHKSGGNLKRVRELLNHNDEAVTMLYAMADTLTERRLNNGKI